MNRYMSVDQIYVEKLAELCGDSYDASYNSHNLWQCKMLHEKGYSWKTIYFALADYFSRIEEEWEHAVVEDDEKLFERVGVCRGQWLIGDTDRHREVLERCLNQAKMDDMTNLTAEEFCFNWYKDNYRK